MVHWGVQAVIVKYQVALIHSVTLVLTATSAWVIGVIVAGLLDIRQEVVLPVISAPEQKILKPNLAIPSLFGQVEAKQTVSKLPLPQKAVQTKLNLTLLGTVSLGRSGVALVQKGQKQWVVSVGETILPGVSLKAVYDNEVLLDRQGREERLLFKASKHQLSLNAVNQLTLNKPMLSTKKRNEIKNIQSQLIKEPITITNYIRFEPVLVKGKWQAIKLWPRSDKALFTELGFKSGDVLTLVNGHSIEELTKNTSIWQEFLSNSKFELEIERQGIRQQVHVDLE